MDSNIAGHTVLLIWSGASPPEDIQETVDQLKGRVGGGGKVNLEHVDRLKLCKLLFSFSI